MIWDGRKNKQRNSFKNADKYKQMFSILKIMLD